MAFLAAGLSYYVFFSIFPLLLVLVAVGGQFLSEQEAMRRTLAFVAEVAPHQATLVSSVLEAVVSHRASAGFLGFLALLWSAKAVFQALAEAMNLIWRVPGRTWLLDNLIALAAALVSGGLIIVTGVLTAAAQTVMAYPIPLLGLTPAAIPGFVALLAALTPPLMTFALLTALYAWLPNRPLRPGQVWPAAALATVAWELLSRAFGWYVTHVTDLSWVYGSLGSMVGFLLWLYASANLFLAGVVIARDLNEPLNRQ